MTPQALIFAVVFVCAFVVMPTLALRYKRLELRHKERMTAFEKGIPLPPDPPDSSTPTLETYLLRGLVWLATGVGLSVMLFIMLPMVANRQLGDRYYQEQRLREQGMAKEEIHEVMKDDDLRWEAQRQHSRGLAALGIVPAAIGLAYLLFYYEQKRRRPSKMEV